MRVLLLRPEPQASRMAEVLSVHGIPAEVAPMMRIVPRVNLVASILEGAQKPDALIVTSAQALFALCADKRCGEVKAFPFVAVGPATAAAAEKRGFTHVITAGGQARAIIACVAESFPQGAHLIHLAGMHRTGEIAADLARRGFATRVIEAYEAEAVERLPEAVLQGLERETFDLAVVGSARTADIFRRHMERAFGEKSFPRPTILAISEAAAAPLQGMFARIITCDPALGDAFVEKILTLAGQ